MKRVRKLATLVVAAIAPWVAIGGVMYVAGCTPIPASNPGYVICNEMGNDTGCGDNVAIDVE